MKQAPRIRISGVLRIWLVALTLPVIAFWMGESQGYERWRDNPDGSGGFVGCTDCHGDFTDGTSQKSPAPTFPSDNKHTMHRAANQMDTECDFCHTSGDNRNPWIGSSEIDENFLSPGPGCTGCHNGEGLRLHHAVSNETTCFDTPGCHMNTAAPPEDTVPQYYTVTGVFTEASNPCNDVAAAKTGENWTIGDFLGLDNDGDGFYDGADTDCGAVAGAGDVGNPLTVQLEANGDVTLLWAGSCLASDDDYEVYEGPIGGLYDQHQFVLCTTAGATTATFTPAGTSSYYLVVPANSVVEGSYGLSRIPDGLGGQIVAERVQGVSTCANQMIASCP